MLRPHALREQTNFYRGAGLRRPLCSNSRADHQAVAVAPERRMWSVCGMGDTRLRWREEVCCRREAAESERSIARILGIHHAAALGAADKRLLSPVKRRDQSIAPPSYRQSAQFGIERMLWLFVGMCPKGRKFWLHGGCSICKAILAQLGVRIGRFASADQWSHTSWPFGLIVSPTTHIH